MATSRTGWLGQALRRQALVASFVIAACSAFSLGGLRLALSLQVGVLLAGVILVGFPHGAFDDQIARPLLAPRLGRFWWVVFGLAYIGLAGMVWLVWLAAPQIALGLFLAGSVIHFGYGDAEGVSVAPDAPRWAAVFIFGAIPILLPIAFHPLAAAPVLAAIGGVAEPRMAAALSLSIWLTPFWGASFLWVWRFGRVPIANVFFAASTAFGFVVLPPLLAFGLYFGLMHSPRHLLRLGSWHDPNDALRAARWGARVMGPAILIAGLGVAALAFNRSYISFIMLASVFRIIAALTLPHMIVTAWLRPMADENLRLTTEDFHRTRA